MNIKVEPKPRYGCFCFGTSRKEIKAAQRQNSAKLKEIEDKELNEGKADGVAQKIFEEMKVTK